MARSWNSYLALNPPKPNPKLAKEMLRVFGEEGLNQPAAEVQVLQIVVANEPQQRVATSAELAEYAYKAHNERQGDLASEKAVSLAPASERAQLKKELAELKKSSAGGSSTHREHGRVSTSGAASGRPTAPSRSAARPTDRRVRQRHGTSAAKSNKGLRMKVSDEHDCSETERAARTRVTRRPTRRVC